MKTFRPPLVFPGPSAEFIRTAILDSDVILEYGAGGSTVFAAEQPGKTVISTESDVAWLDNIIAVCRENQVAGKLIPVNPQIGATKQWGFPKDHSNWHRFPRYARTPWKVLEKEGLEPDLILIDGRFRVSCFIASCIHLRKPTRILFDDYGPRERYHRVEKLIRPVEVFDDRIGVFDVPPGLVTADFMLENIELFFMANI